MSPSLQATRPSYRNDIQGLRGLAVLMVVVYHVFFGRVSGGVDVFLFISAYFLTGSFIRRIDRGEPTRPFAYWAKTFKRLLPPALVVVLSTLVLIRLFFDPIVWIDYLNHAAASLGQVLNWVLMAESVDYYAADHSTASPFQHFWSLSIQGQVFLLFPLLFAMGAWVARRTGVSANRAIGAFLGVITVASFVFSVINTELSQTTAYFNTFTRLWEFSLGGLAAIAMPVIASHLQRLSPEHSRIVSWLVGLIGLVGLLSCGLILDVAGLFPGWIALWPLLSALLIMTAGAAPHVTRRSVTAALSTRLAGWFGSVSYALYLVHWPLLVTALAIQGRPMAGPLTGFVVIGASLVLAWVLTICVDSPVRRSSWLNASAWRSAVAAGLCLLIGLGVSVGGATMLRKQHADAQLQAAQNNPGARILEPGQSFNIPKDAPELPGAAMVSKEWFGLPHACTDRFSTKAPVLESCRMSVADVDDRPVVVMIGNSRMEQFSPSFAGLAEEHGWQAIALYQGGCYLGEPGGDDGICDQFYEQGMKYLLEVRPDAVVLTSTFVPVSGDEAVSEHLDDTLSQLQEAGTKVIAYRDQPRLSENPTTCDRAASDCKFEITNMPGERPDAASDCKFEITNMPGERPDAALLDAFGSTVYPIDLTEQTCPDSVCVPEIGNVTVFIDGYHLTRTYAASMQWAVEAQLLEAGWEWDRPQAG